MTEAVKGRTVQEAEELFRNVHETLTREGEGVERSKALLGKLAALVSVKEFPLRVKCATLAWHTLRSALRGERTMVTTE
jgi:nitrogen fixation NifU-like protein